MKFKKSWGCLGDCPILWWPVEGRRLLLQGCLQVGWGLEKWGAQADCTRQSALAYSRGTRDASHRRRASSPACCTSTSMGMTDRWRASSSWHLTASAGWPLL